MADEKLPNEEYFKKVLRETQETVDKESRALAADVEARFLRIPDVKKMQLTAMGEFVLIYGTLTQRLSIDISLFDALELWKDITCTLESLGDLARQIMDFDGLPQETQQYLHHGTSIAMIDALILCICEAEITGTNGNTYKLGMNITRDGYGHLLNARKKIAEGSLFKNVTDDPVVVAISKKIAAIRDEFILLLDYEVDPDFISGMMDSAFTQHFLMETHSEIKDQDEFRELVTGFSICDVSWREIIFNEIPDEKPAVMLRAQSMIQRVLSDVTFNFNSGLLEYPRQTHTMVLYVAVKFTDTDNVTEATISIPTEVFFKLRSGDTDSTLVLDALVSDMEEKIGREIDNSFPIAWSSTPFKAVGEFEDE